MQLHPEHNLGTLDSARTVHGNVSTSTIAREVPLCVDLDHTLVWADTLLETVLNSFRKGMWWLLIPFWLLGGKANLKRQLAARGPIDVTALPYNEELLCWLRDQSTEGRQIFLCTGADTEIAKRVAHHVGTFHAIVASDGLSNLVGPIKRQVLEQRFGRGGFDYVGDSLKDLPIWKAARLCLVANPSFRLRRRLRRSGINVSRVFHKPHARSPLVNWVRALRLHQWTKNLLIFLPLALSHRFQMFEASVVAFFAFSFAATAGYLINDLLDLAADRKNVKKRSRPFASGELSAANGLFAIPAFLLCAAAMSSLLPFAFSLCIGVYFLVSFCYSMWWKRSAPIDIVVLAGLYALRIEAGGAATGIVISPWTLAVSVFLFLSLAMVKRVSEIRELAEQSGKDIPGRMYLKSDLDQLSSLGGAAGYMSVLVTALYLNSPDVQKLYSRPDWLWLILPIMLYWITRIWLLASRGQVHQDPVLFALKDRATYIAGLLALVVGLLAT